MKVSFRGNSSPAIAAWIFRTLPLRFATMIHLAKAKHVAIMPPRCIAFSSSFAIPWSLPLNQTRLTWANSLPKTNPLKILWILWVCKDGWWTSHFFWPCSGWVFQIVRWKDPLGGCPHESCSQDGMNPLIRKFEKVTFSKKEGSVLFCQF